MSVTVTQFRDRFAAFCDTKAATVQGAIDQAEGCINRTQWGENRADEACYYLAAHFLTVNAQGDAGAPGAVTAEAEGQISASYAVSDDAKQSVYGSTAYGRQYLELRRTAFPSRIACT